MKRTIAGLLALLLWACGARTEGTLVSLGDSIARGYGLESRETERYSALVAAELNLTEINLGVNGQLASETLQTAKAREDDLKGAEVILLSIGANHVLPAMAGRESPEAALAGFEGDLRALLAYLREAAPDAEAALIAFYNPYPGSPRCGEICDCLNEILRACAEEYGFHAAETAQALAGEKGVLLDGDIHPSALGHRLLAEAILAALEEEP